MLLNSGGLSTFTPDNHRYYEPLYRQRQMAAGYARTEHRGAGHDPKRIASLEGIDSLDNATIEIFKEQKNRRDTPAQARYNDGYTMSTIFHNVSIKCRKRCAE